VGYLVFRFDESKANRAGSLIDFLVSRDDPAVLGSLVAAATERLRQRGSDILACSLAQNQAAWIRLLFRNGFVFRTPGGTVVMGTGGLERDTLPEVKDWFLTRADSDVDMR
jgi:hypothetical protein